MLIDYNNIKGDQDMTIAVWNILDLDEKAGKGE